MSLSQDHIDQLIHRYLNDNLSDSERLKFEEALKTDNSLAEQFASEKLMHDLLLQGNAIELKETLRVQGERVKKTRQLKRSVGLGLALLALTGATFYGLNTPSQEVENSSIDSVNVADSILENTGDDLRPQTVRTESHEAVIRELKIDEMERDSVREKLVLVSDSIKNTEVELPVTELSVEVDVNNEESEVLVPISEEITPNAVVNCEELVLDYEVESTCVGRENGEFEVIDIRNGTAPYKVFFNEVRLEDVLLSHLVSGVYEVHIEDARGCVNIISVEIEEEFCEDKIYAFNPGDQDSWGIPNASSQSGTLFIYSRNGQLLVEQTLNGDNDSWDGVTNQGSKVSKGVYVFLIQYEDGSMLKDELNVNW